MSFLDEERIREMVRQTLKRELGGEDKPVPPQNEGRRALIDEAQVRSLAEGGELVVPSGALVTPLARDAARARNIRLVEEDRPEQRARRSGVGQRRIAIGADHGGVELKRTLVDYLEQEGFEVVDVGPFDGKSVDYPDYAYAVARLVSEQEVEAGIMIDGVGIGSCMAANKVPGIRASMCYDVSTARNAREHNHANCLTLGGQLTGPLLAKQIVSTWLSTPFGPGRHANRVAKIMEIEQRYLRTGGHDRPQHSPLATGRG